MGLLDGGISKIVTGALSGLFLNHVLIRKTTTSDPNKPWEKAVTAETNYSCKAVALDYKAHEVDGERVKQTDKKILILAGTLSVEPQMGDYIQLVGETRRYNLVSPVKKDPASATYECQGR